MLVPQEVHDTLKPGKINYNLRATNSGHEVTLLVELKVGNNSFCNLTPLFPYQEPSSTFQDQLDQLGRVTYLAELHPPADSPVELMRTDKATLRATFTGKATYIWPYCLK